MLVLLDIYLLKEGKQKYVQVSSASKYDGEETEISWKKETKTNNLGTRTLLDSATTLIWVAILY